MLFDKNNYEFLLVCLGNPGDEYCHTRHNAGFLFSEWVEYAYKIKIKKLKLRAVYGEISFNGKKGLILRPQTFMNDSGIAVAAFCSAYNIPPESIIVVADDINFEVGQMRIRRKGSDGGQKGLRSIIECLKTEQFPRIRIGVGHKAFPQQDLADYVLSNFSSAELSTLPEVFEKVYDSVGLILAGDTERAMSKYNS